MIIGITAGAFDLCHPGHLLFFKECRQHCDKLVVMLQIDPSIDRPHKNKPVETSFERWVRLKSCVSVDEVIPYDTEKDLLTALNALTWHVRFLGTDYEGKDFTGKDMGRVCFIKRNHEMSSSALRARLK